MPVVHKNKQKERERERAVGPLLANDRLIPYNDTDQLLHQNK